jgi:hypothetical protein
VKKQQMHALGCLCAWRNASEACPPLEDTVKHK